MPSNQLTLCHLFSCPQSFPVSGSFPVRSHQVAKILELQLQHQSFQWIFRIDFLRMDWFDLLAVQGTLKSFQHHSSKASIIWLSVFFTVQLSHTYVTTGKTIALTIWTFVSKVMSLLFNTLSRFAITFLPMNIQGWFPLGLTALRSMQSKGLSRVYSSITIQKPQFFGAQPSLWSSSHIRTWLLEKPQLWPYGPLSAKWCLCFLNTLSNV